MNADRRHTEADAGVLLSHIVTLLIGEEHVGRQTTLGGIGVWRCLISWAIKQDEGDRSTLLLLASSISNLGLGLAGGLLLRHDDRSGEDARQRTRQLGETSCKHRQSAEEVRCRLWL